MVFICIAQFFFITLQRNPPESLLSKTNFGVKFFRSAFLNIPPPVSTRRLTAMLGVTVQR